MSCEGNCNGCGSCGTPLGLDDYELEQSEFIYNPDEYSRPAAVLLGLTANCNLQCPYCFTHQHNEEMSFETACKAIDIAIMNFEYKKENNLDRHNKPIVVFFGGEPLIKFNDLIKPLVEKYGDSIEWSITTNGVLLDEDVVDFFWKNNVNVLLSFDGVKEVQDIQRPGKGFSSYDKVMNNIPYLLLRLPYTCVRFTITKTLLPHLFETYSMFEELGFTCVTSGVNAFEDWTQDDIKLCTNEMKKIGARMFDTMRGITLDPFCNFETLTNEVIKIVRLRRAGTKLNNKLLRCGLGTTTFSVTPSGLIVPCQEEVTKPKTIIGDVYKGGINIADHEEFLQKYWDSVNNFSCEKSCPPMIRDFCMSEICPSRFEDLHHTKSTAECGFYTACYSAAFPLYRLTRGTVNPRIREIFAEDTKYNLLDIKENDECELINEL